MMSHRIQRQASALLASLGIHAAALGGFLYHAAQQAPRATQTAQPSILLATLWQAPPAPLPPPAALSMAPPTRPQTHQPIARMARRLAPREPAAHTAASPSPSPAEPPTEAAPTHAPSIEAAQAMANVAPDTEAAPGAANIASEADYLSRLKAWLEQHKAYPRRARLQAIEGEVMIAITFDRSGRVLAQQLIASSGHASLDRAALAAVESANPLPAIPPELPHQQMTLNVPFGFHLM